MDFKYIIRGKNITINVWEYILKTIYENDKTDKMAMVQLFGVKYPRVIVINQAGHTSGMMAM